MKIRKLLALLMTLALLAGLMPAAALAAGEVSYLYYTAEVTDGVAALTRNTGSVTEYTLLDAGATDWTDGFYVADGEVTIDDRVTVTGNVTLILCDDAVLTIPNGISVKADPTAEDPTAANSLTICAQSEGERVGKLLVSATDDYTAGIGGIYGDADDETGDCGTVTIHGGSVTATGGYCGAGIGGGLGDGCVVTVYGGAVTATGGANGGAGIGGGEAFGGDVVVTVYGGTVTATGSDGGAGIGGGCFGNGGVVTVYGGTVMAAGSDGGAGIGGGVGFYDIATDDFSGGDGGEITIYGGTVEATGGGDENADCGGAGIGGGGGYSDYDSEKFVGGAGGRITIKGGTVTATGGYEAAGIGGGYCGDGGVIRISGEDTVVTATGGYDGVGIGGGCNGAGGEITISGGTVTATGNSYAAGIGSGWYRYGATITISGGTVTAAGGYEGAGIGSGYAGYEYAKAYGDSANKITISGEDTVVTATGGYEAAGIGGGYCDDGGDIRIEGGTVTAIGSYGGAGIGGGAYGGYGYYEEYFDSVGSVTVTGGTVTATGGSYAAGIGGGHEGYAVPVKVTGGMVSACGDYGGAGIGSGFYPYYGKEDAGCFTVTGGTVIATGGYGAAGIGGGYKGDGGETTICGGTVTALGGEYGAGIGGGYACCEEDRKNYSGGAGGTVSINDSEEEGAGNDAMVLARGGAATKDGCAPGEGIGRGGYEVIDGAELPGSGDLFVGEGTTLLGGDETTGMEELASPFAVRYRLMQTKDQPKKETEDVKYLAGSWDGTEVSFEEKTAECTLVSETDALWTDGWYAVKESVALAARPTAVGDVHLVLCDGAELSALRGVTVGADSSLSIYAQSTGGDMGALTAVGTAGSSGVGSGYYSDCGAITIHGGKITATGGEYGYPYSDYYSFDSGGAGIGGGDGGDGGDITVYGGVVTAYGGAESAGIGAGEERAFGVIAIHGGTVEAHGGSGGYSYYDGNGTYLYEGGAGIGGSNDGGDGGEILITGGTVTAYGGAQGAGIGSGDDGDDECEITITITGGTVEAHGGEYYYAYEGKEYWYDGGAGIGGAYYGHAASVTISGGTVTAYGGAEAAGIGGGDYGDGGKITISGGTVTAVGGTYIDPDGTDSGYGGAGIGGGDYGDGVEITISGEDTVVEAAGGLWGAGIGGGYHCDGGEITISGGTVTATGGDYAAGIGGGAYGDGGTVVIIGAEVEAIAGPIEEEVKDDYDPAEGIGRGCASDVYNEHPESGSLTVGEILILERKATADAEYEAYEKDAFEDAEDGRSLKDTAERPAYMRTQLVSHTVTFETFGGTPVPEPQSVKHGKTAEKPATDPAKAGAAFDKWYLDSELKTEWVPDDYKIVCDTTIYAGYAAVYTVDFETNGGTPVPAQQKVRAGEKAARPADPTKAGFSFGGWFSDEACTKAWSFDSPVNEDLTLYAKWTKVKPGQVTVTFNSGVSGGDYKITCDVNTVLTLPGGGDLDGQQSFKKPANAERFVEWKLGDTAYAAGAAYTVAADVTFVAVWKEKSVGPYDYDDYGPPPPIVAPTVHGTVTYTPARPGVGTKVTVFVTPDKGYLLLSLTAKDSSGKDVTLTKNPDGTWSFTQGNMQITLTAVFKDPIADFSDLDPDAWYAEGVRYVLSRGIMEGYGNGLFGPNDTTTRAMAVTVIWKLEGRPTVDYALSYSDVPEGEWYSEAVRWATSVGIVEGWTDEATGKPVFQPGAEVTREAFATMLYRYGQLNGKGFTGLWSFQLDFPDAGDVSPWAKEAVSWMVMQSVVKGMDGRLNPKGWSTRAQLATMLYRFAELP